jgi:hypothetical protein
MRKLLVLVSIIVLIALIGATTVACKKSDEALVKDLIYRSTEAWNNKDYRAIYETMSPNYRDTASYEEFEEYIQGVAELLLVTLGTTNYEISGIEVRIEDSWAFASYSIVVEGGVIPPMGDDIYRKVEGKWYDVTEDKLSDPGYNEEDLPPGY